MKILQIAHSLPFLNQAGTEIYTYNLSLELSRRHEVYIISRTCDIKQKEYEVTKKVIGRITFYLINNTFKWCDSFETYYENSQIDSVFSKLIDEIKPDIVHIQHLVFLSTGFIREIKKRLIPIVFTIHDYWLMCPKWHLLKKDDTPCDKAEAEAFDNECLDCLREILFIKKGAKRLYVYSRNLLPAFVLKYFKRAYFSFMRKSPDSAGGIARLAKRNQRIRGYLDMIDVFFAPSMFARDKFIRFGIHPEKIKILRHGLNSRLFHGFPKTESEKIRLAFIGTILPAKGLHILIEALNGIKAKNIELKIYGKIYSYIGFEDYLPYLKRIIKNKNIKFMNEFNYQNIADVFRDIDVLIIPSIWHENAPSVIQEAFITRTPVIASNIGGMPEFLIDGINGFLFNPGDKNDLRAKVRRIIKNPWIIGELKKNMSPVKGIEDNAREIEDVYDRLIADTAFASPHNPPKRYKA